MEQWKFSKIFKIEEKIFNPLLEKFVGYGLDGLVRENIQNSLDAKIAASSSPVVVKIKVGEMESKNIPGIDHIRKRIEVLSGGNIYTKNSIKNMSDSMHEEKNMFMSFEDENTKGLNGKTWDIYAYQKGEHNVEDDESVENARGGSHGVGKIASNAASSINMMFFANCNAEGTKHLGGTVQLVEHKYGGQKFRSTGYFTDGKEEEKFVAYDNVYNEVFEKNTRGLKIIIPFLREEYNDTNGIIRAVCDNFFVSILKDNLVVHVNGFEINSSSIKEIMGNADIYTEEVLKKTYTPLYIKSYIEQDPIEIKINDAKRNEYSFLLFLNYDDSIKVGRTAIVRTIGMKIEDFRVSRYARSPYNAVLIPQSAKEDAFLKSVENESHTKLSELNIRDVSEKKNAKRFINNLDKRIGEEISKIEQKNNPEDGELDTKSLLCLIEHKFAEKLRENTSTVYITPAGKDVKEVIIKKDINKINNNSGEKPSKPERDRTIRNRDKVGKNKNKEVHMFKLYGNQVKRVIVDNKEELLIDLSYDSEYRNEKKATLHLKLVDGEGRVRNDKVDITKHYSRVRDLMSDCEYIMEDNKIFNLDIKKKKIHLQLDMAEGANHALKFVYVLEVAS